MVISHINRITMQNSSDLLLETLKYSHYLAESYDEKRRSLVFLDVLKRASRNFVTLYVRTVRKTLPNVTIQ